jgi:hypothetical protein
VSTTLRAPDVLKARVVGFHAPTVAIENPVIDLAPRHGRAGHGTDLTPIAVKSA